MSVTFTKSGARRIVDAVREVERETKSLRGNYRAPSLDANFVKMKVVTVEGDYLTCKLVEKIEGTTITVGDTTINVAKPWELRETYLDGTTNNGITYAYTDGENRNADDGTNDEDQVIVPAYDIHDDVLINAFQVYTGVTVGSEPVVWEDMNTAGRAWAKQDG